MTECVDPEYGWGEKAPLLALLSGVPWKRLRLAPDLEEAYHLRRRELSVSGVRDNWVIVAVTVALIGVVTFWSGMVADEIHSVVVFGYVAVFFSIALVATGALVSALNARIDDLMMVAALIALGGMHLGVVVAPEGSALRSTAEYGVIFITIAVCTISGMSLPRALLVIVTALVGLLLASVLSLLYPASPGWLGLPPVFLPVLDGFTPDWYRFPYYAVGSAAIAALIGVSQDVRERTVFLQQQLLKLERRELGVLSQELAVLSRQDALTGLANRRHFDEVLTREWAACQRECTAMNLLFIDVDFFKRYNDHYGHQAGDECLTQVARALASQAKRGADFVARYGGEEFVAFFPRTNTEGLLAIAQRMLQAVDALQIPHAASDAAPCVTISIGLAVVTPTPGSSVETLVEAADTALYRAKHAGRHRCVASWQ